MRLVRGPAVRERRRLGLRRAVARGARLTRTAVVVVNWNRADLTARAARAVLDEGAADEVVVVDNGSDDHSAAVLRRELPEAVLVERPTNGGFAAGANAGIRATGADVVVLLNNDAIPAPGFVRALLDHLDQAAPDVAAVTGRIVLAGRWSRLPSGTPAPTGGRTLRDHDGTTWLAVGDGDSDSDSDSDDETGNETGNETGTGTGEQRLNSTGVRIDRDGNGFDRDWFAPADTVADTRVFGFSGGASAIRRTALDDVGLLDESLFMYYEDTELAWRLARRGWRVEYAANAVVAHEHSSSSGVQSDVFLFRNARNRVVVALWHASAGTVVRAVARTAVRAVIGMARSGTRREARLVLAALADVARHLPRHLVHRARVTRRASVPRRAVDTLA